MSIRKIPDQLDFQPIPMEVATAINDACAVINHWATKKGWNETADSVSHKAEQIALMHSELSECLEFIRTKHEVCPFCGGHSWHPVGPVNEVTCVPCDKFFSRQELRLVPAPDDKVPVLTGEAAELADVLIRIFHYCGKRNIDLGRAVRLKHEYNITRPYRHGKTI